MFKGIHDLKRPAHKLNFIIGGISGGIVAMISKRLAHPYAPTSIAIYVFVGVVVGLAAAIFVKYRASITEHGKKT